MIDFTASQVVGSVDSVSPDEISVALSHDAPQATALNSSTLQRFPRINGWVLIPNEVGYLIGTVKWVGVDRDRSLAREYKKDASLVDMPYSARRLRLAPLGTLRWRSNDGLEEPELIRGIVSYPSVGASVLVPTARQLRAIAQTADPAARLKIGTSPLAADVDVFVDPDKLFGRHLAVLGNTGSGKSCTVAGLIRWSLEAAKAHMHVPDAPPHARFIILDPNGEYSKSFDDVASKVRVFRPVPMEDEGEKQLTVPAWLWSGAEWAAISRASPQVQRPLLLQALRNLRNSLQPGDSSTSVLAQELSGFLSIFLVKKADPPSYATVGKHFGITELLSVLRDSMGRYDEDIHRERLASLIDVISQMVLSRQGSDRFRIYSPIDIDRVISELTTALEDLSDELILGSISEDAPSPFDLSSLISHVEALSRRAEFAGASGYVGSLATRLRSILTDARLRDVICPEDGVSLTDWLTDTIGDERGTNGEVVVIDLSLLASDVLHTVVSVLSRVIMEASQYITRVSNEILPTVLVLEEAHTFVSSASRTADVPATHDLCREAIERIAREGRKFGVGLVLSSQRPSELSATVLSQCNSFILHRLVNDQDQRLVSRLVPDALGDLLRELPSLPSRQAILLGWATAVPTMVEISDLDAEHRPRSDDPQFWNTWTRQKDVAFDWQAVESAWIGGQ
ncbi:ATP-binding protein [Arthrobacter sp. MDT2-2]